MSKIVCDICGTSYAETAKQCPICGSVRPGDAQRITNEINKDGNVSTGYTHVKGGRFSKSNVKKRTKNQGGNGKNPQRSSQHDRNDEDAKSNRGLVLLAIMLLLAIIGVVAYIAIRFFAPISDPNAGNPTVNLGSDIDLSCTDLTLDTYSITFDQADVSKYLKVKTTPEKPSETVTFVSDNPEVVTVSNKGLITPVANGTATITVTCGNIKKECKVTVALGDQGTTPEATTPDNTTPEDTTVPDESTPTEVLKLNRQEFTLSYKGETWDLYDGSIARNLITWTSANESIVKFDNGKAIAVGNGDTYLYAEYQGQKVSCHVICSFKDSSGVEGNGGVSEDGGGSSSTIITGTVCNVTEFVNVRKGPGTGYDKNGTLNLNDRVTITETAKDASGYTWGKFGADKWVRMDFINVD